MTEEQYSKLKTKVQSCSNTDDILVIDVNNIVVEKNTNGDKIVYIERLLQLIAALNAKGFGWYCFADANIEHLVTATHSLEQERMWHDFAEYARDRITIVPAGTQADENILMLADVNGYDIISRDRFLNPPELSEKYPWVKQVDGHGNHVSVASRRLHKPTFTKDWLQIPDLDIFWDNQKLGLLSGKPKCIAAAACEVFSDRTTEMQLPDFESMKVVVQSSSDTPEVLKFLKNTMNEDIGIAGKAIAAGLVGLSVCKAYKDLSD